MRALNVWINGDLVGTWVHGRNDVHTFTYDPVWETSPERRSLSLSLPLGSTSEIRGAPVIHYFDNLLPDADRIRKRLKMRYQTRSDQAFDLLEAIGRDCVGAVQLLPPGTEPAGFDELAYTPLDEAGVADQLRRVPEWRGYAVTGPSDFRISIAGAQEKTALLKMGDQWCLPQGATPTSHIFKLPLGLVGGFDYDLRHSVENEWLCLRFLNAVGLPVASAEIAQFEDQKALIVERFDRAWVPHHLKADAWLARVPQEDFCQALGISPDQKYEVDGGPGMRESLRLLQGSQAAFVDRSIFVLAQFAFWLLAATDGHGKNFSIRLDSGDRYSLTPLYDVLSAWPIIGRGPISLSMEDATLAMAVRGRNAHYRLSEIQARHWKALAEGCGTSDVWGLMVNLATSIEGAIGCVMAQLPENYPIVLAETIFNGVRKQASRFLVSMDSKAS